MGGELLDDVLLGLVQGSQGVEHRQEPPDEDLQQGDLDPQAGEAELLAHGLACSRRRAGSPLPHAPEALGPPAARVAQPAAGDLGDAGEDLVGGPGPVGEELQVHALPGLDRRHVRLPQAPGVCVEARRQGVHLGEPALALGDEEPVGAAGRPADLHHQLLGELADLGVGARLQLQELGVGLFQGPLHLRHEARQDLHQPAVEEAGLLHQGQGDLALELVELGQQVRLDPIHALGELPAREHGLGPNVLPGLREGGGEVAGDLFDGLLLRPTAAGVRVSLRLLAARLLRELDLLVDGLGSPLPLGDAHGERVELGILPGLDRTLPVELVDQDRALDTRHGTLDHPLPHLAQPLDHPTQGFPGRLPQVRAGLAHLLGHPLLRGLLPAADPAPGPSRRRAHQGPQLVTAQADGHLVVHRDDPQAVLDAQDPAPGPIGGVADGRISLQGQRLWHLG